MADISKAQSAVDQYFTEKETVGRAQYAAPVETTAEKVFQGLATPLRMGSEALTSLMLRFQDSTLSMPEAWDLANGDRTNKQWYQWGDKPVTFGQAYYGMYTPDNINWRSTEEVEKHFSTGAAHWVSGGIDFAGNLLLDPLNYVGLGIGAKVAAALGIGAKAGAGAAALAGAAGMSKKSLSALERASALSANGFTDIRDFFRYTNQSYDVNPAAYGFRIGSPEYAEAVKRLEPYFGSLEDIAPSLEISPLSDNASYLFDGTRYRAIENGKLFNYDMTTTTWVPEARISPRILEITSSKVNPFMGDDKYGAFIPLPTSSSLRSAPLFDGGYLPDSATIGGFVDKDGQFTAIAYDKSAGTYWGFGNAGKWQEHTAAVAPEVFGEISNETLKLQAFKETFTNIPKDKLITNDELLMEFPELGIYSKDRNDKLIVKLTTGNKIEFKNLSYYIDYSSDVVENTVIIAGSKKNPIGYIYPLRENPRWKPLNTRKIKESDIEKSIRSSEADPYAVTEYDDSIEFANPKLNDDINELYHQVRANKLSQEEIDLLAEHNRNKLYLGSDENYDALSGANSYDLSEEASLSRWETANAVDLYGMSETIAKPGHHIKLNQKELPFESLGVNNKWMHMDSSVMEEFTHYVFRYRDKDGIERVGLVPTNFRRLSLSASEVAEREIAKGANPEAFKGFTDFPMTPVFADESGIPYAFGIDGKLVPVEEVHLQHQILENIRKANEIDSAHRLAEKIKKTHKMQPEEIAADEIRIEAGRAEELEKTLAEIKKIESLPDWDKIKAYGDDFKAHGKPQERPSDPTQNSTYSEWDNLNKRAERLRQPKPKDDITFGGFSEEDLARIADEEKKRPIQYAFWYKIEQNTDGTYDITTMAKRTEYNGFGETIKNQEDVPLFTWNGITEKELEEVHSLKFSRNYLEGIPTRGSEYWNGKLVEVEAKNPLPGEPKVTTKLEGGFLNPDEPAFFINIDEVSQMGYPKVSKIDNTDMIAESKGLREKRVFNTTPQLHERTGRVIPRYNLDLEQATKIYNNRLNYLLNKLALIETAAVKAELRGRTIDSGTLAAREKFNRQIDELKRIEPYLSKETWWQVWLSEDYIAPLAFQSNTRERIFLNFEHALNTVMFNRGSKEFDYAGHQLHKVMQKISNGETTPVVTKATSKIPTVKAEKAVTSTTQETKLNPTRPAAGKRLRGERPAAKQAETTAPIKTETIAPVNPTRPASKEYVYGFGTDSMDGNFPKRNWASLHPEWPEDKIKRFQQAEHSRNNDHLGPEDFLKDKAEEEEFYGLNSAEPTSVEPTVEPTAPVNPAEATPPTVELFTRATNKNAVKEVVDNGGIYIGRKSQSYPYPDYYGNPYVVKDGKVKEAVDAYREDLMSVLNGNASSDSQVVKYYKTKFNVDVATEEGRLRLIERIKQLDGKQIVCAGTEPASQCHGNVLIEALDMIKSGEIK